MSFGGLVAGCCGLGAGHRGARRLRLETFRQLGSLRSPGSACLAVSGGVWFAASKGGGVALLKP